MDTKAKIGCAMGLVPVAVIFAFIGYTALTNREAAIAAAITCGIVAYIVLMLWLLSTGAWGKSG